MVRVISLADTLCRIPNCNLGDGVIFERETEAEDDNDLSPAELLCLSVACAISVGATPKRIEL